MKIKKILRWIISIGLFMYIIPSLFLKNYIIILLILISVILFSPPIAKILEKKFEIKFSILNNWVVLSFGLILAINSISGFTSFSKSYLYHYKAKNYISQNDFVNSNKYIMKSYNKFPLYLLDKQLYKDFKKFNDNAFFNQAYFDMSNQEYESLVKNNYSKKFIDNPKINKLFIQKLKKYSSKRDSIINKFNHDKRLSEKKKREMATKVFNYVIGDKIKNKPGRKELILKQFSQIDGTHREFTKLIKNHFSEVSDFKIVETKYRDEVQYIYVLQDYTYYNEENEMQYGWASAKVDFEGNVIEVISFE